MKKNTLSLGTRLAVSLGSLTGMLMLLAWSGIHTVAIAGRLFDNVANSTATRLVLAAQIDAAESDMAVAQQGLVLSTYAKNPGHKTEAKRQFSESIGKARQALKEIRPLLVSGREKRTASDLEILVSKWQEEYAELERLADAGQADDAARILSEKLDLMHAAAGEHCITLSATASELMKSDRQSAAERFAASQWIALLLSGFGLALAAISFATVRSSNAKLRQFAIELMDGASQVASSSAQVASASQSLAQGTSEQAATLEETSASTTQITAITRKNADNTRTVAGLMNETTQRVGGANQNLEEMVRSMKEINSSSEKISKIIRVIDEIAFQTNILALNAAVEAARAGEAGMGFAVVADEVRNLAHRSAQAAKDTASLIEESIARSHAGSKKLEQVVGSIQQITGSAAQVKILVDQVHLGSQEQFHGIHQIATAVGQMEQVTQRSAANAEQSAAASEEMAAQTQSLYAIVQKMRELVDGRAGDIPTTPRASMQLANHTPPAAPVASSKKLTSFPLDESENGF